MLDDALVAVGELDQELAFAIDVRGRLFDVDVLAGLQGTQRDRAVPVVRRRDEDGVDVLVVEHAAEIFDGAWGAALGFLHDAGGLGQAIGIDVAQGGDRRIAPAGERSGEGSRPAAGADHRADEAIIRLLRGGGSGGAGERQARADSGRGSYQKAAPRGCV